MRLGAIFVAVAALACSTAALPSLQKALSFDYKQGCHDAASCREYLNNLQTFVEVTLEDDDINKPYLRELLTDFISVRAVDKDGNWPTLELSDVDKQWCVGERGGAACFLEGARVQRGVTFGVVNIFCGCVFRDFGGWLTW